MANKIKKAVILVAGLGSRLKPLTDEVPKCLTEVNGKPILLQTIQILERNGIEEAVIVIGYLGAKVIDKLGERYGNMKLTYIWNKIYNETNSMYSAWLAREYLEQGAFLIEGDTVFEEALIIKALQMKDDNSYWIADRFKPEYDGSMSTTDKTGRIVDLKIVRGKLSEYRDNYFKSTGVLKLSSKYGRLLSQWLQAEKEVGNVKIYYDLVIAKHLKEFPIYICNITGEKWIEIDNHDDLIRANKMFL